ncbi:MAG: Hsp20/alpha crystallin family protein [Gammaproteobacteria bacterium]|nr:Hsp20/alpha crystallin family protein [Gammaproteobacteria bacterium]
MPREVNEMTTREKSREKEKALQPRATSPMTSPWEEMEQWFNEFGRRGWLHPFTRDWPTQELESMAPFEGRTPRVDMIDRDNEIVIKAELPGVKRDDVEVTLSENTVTIRAHTLREEKEEKEEYYRREMSRGDFQRTLTLPSGVDDAKAKASFADGVLELTIPKMEKTSKRKVKVD